MLIVSIFPNNQKFLKILCDISLESLVAKKFFSYIIKIHNWLHNSMSKDLLVALDSYENSQDS